MAGSFEWGKGEGSTLGTLLGHYQGHLARNIRTLTSEKKGGWKTQGRGEHTIKPLPKNGLDSPPMIPFPTPFVHTLSFSLEETGKDQTNPTF